MTSTRETFKKAERLSSRKTITMLFENGNTLFTRYFRVIWAESETNSPFPARIAFSVPKKIFRLAVTRNLLKRRIREAYRKNKSHFYKFLVSENIQVALMVIFRKDSVEEYSTLEKAVREMFDKISTEIRGKRNLKRNT
ncbi:MAG TPA: ribonuclease P protein component [Bacteroidales bacterium]|nr:ribonuclease P protein component [Bacteroidales bacterium]HOS70862.1 ribonuclease P protein component [Bacteroidales bacterium]HQH23153.1 ribonuclease P protein component [Bacteroidales bacterium]HQJ80989.1 ribonuclease P protein component [Bacteroidales bacterium]